jgi:hypothetical protein
MSNEAIIGSIFLDICPDCLIRCYDGEPKDESGPIKWQITFHAKTCNCTICHHRPMKRKDMDSQPREE